MPSRTPRLPSTTMFSLSPFFQTVVRLPATGAG